MKKTNKSLISVLFIFILLFAAVPSASGDPVGPEPTKDYKIAYVTDIDRPFPLKEASVPGVNVTEYILPNELTTLSSASVDLYLIDIRSDIPGLDDKIEAWRAEKPVIVLTKNSSTNIFSAAVSGPDSTPSDEKTSEKAAAYWSRHPQNLKNLLLWSANTFGSCNFGNVGDPIDITASDNRTSILLVVTPNDVAITSVIDEVSDYGIDLKFANLSALKNASRDEAAVDFVLTEIRNFNGDIILEIAAPALNERYESEIKNTVNTTAGLVAVFGKGLTLSQSNLTVYPSSLSDEQITKIKKVGDYWSVVLPENLVRMFIYLAESADGRKDLTSLVKGTMTVPPIGIYHPEAPDLSYNGNKLPHLFDNRTKYNEWYQLYKNERSLENNGQWIVLSSYYRDYQEGKMQTEDMMVQKLEEEGYNVLVIYHPNAASNLSPYFSTDPEENKSVDVFISFQTFGYNKPLNQFNAPVIEAVLLSNYADINEWLKDPNGLKKSTFYYKIDQSEGAGSLFPVGVEIQMSADDPIPYPIEDRVDRILGQAKGYANLRHKSNDAKKVALIYFNHPPGKQNIGASYFNLFASLENIFDALNKENYFTEAWSQEDISQKIMTGGRNVGGWAPGELDKLVEDGMADGSIVLLPVSQYETWVSSMTDGQKKVIDDITAEWGEPGESDFMTVTYESERCFVFPVISNGNVTMMPEPARGWEEDLEKLYHDMNIPVPHQYAAFYLWLQKSEEEGGFGADAMVHLGRHGTQEFLPGKMVCMDESGAADLMIGDVPNIYLYIIDGSGEGLQAKRRGYATLISHLTPPIAKSGLYGELSGLNELIVSYERAQSGGSSSVAEIRQEIIALLENSTVSNDLELNMPRLKSDATYFSESVDDVTEYLELINEQTIPYGTHIFGESLSSEQLSMFLETIYAERLSKLSVSLLPKDLTPTEQKTNVDRLASRMAFYAADNSNSESFISDVSAWIASPEGLDLSVSAPDEELTTELTDLYNNMRGTVSKLDTISETTGLIHALDGQYIDVSPQGDPVRNPDVLPTGRNYVGFVSNKVPTKVATEIGQKMGDELLSAHYNETGKFPEKVGVVLWSVETFRHDGVMEAMALRLMGAEPFRNNPSGSITNTKVNITPEDQLKVTTTAGEIQRPRTDVVITISGLYRDSLPFQIRMIDTAVREVSNYENDSIIANHVRQNSLAMESQLNNLEDAGRAEIIKSYKEADPSYNDDDFSKLAEQLSKIRIFGPPPESYGTGIEKEIEAGQGWDSETAIDNIGELYIFRMANMYTVNSGGDIIFLGNFGKIFEMNLKGVEVVTNSRSSNLYGILDNDDFFQYVGGMSAAVQSLDENKKPPVVKVINLRTANKESVQSLGDFMKLEIRARALNDKYLEGMIASGYSGMKEISEIVDNLWGWQVTTPHAVDEYMWNDVYTQLVTNQTLNDAFKEHNPYAYESLVTRMLDANAKGYWDPSDKTIQNLAKELAETVVASGVACCHHTCGNPTLNNHIAGILSVPGVVEDDVAKQWQQLTEEATRTKIVPTQTKPVGRPSSGTGSANVVESGTDGTEKIQADAAGLSQEETEMSGEGAGTDMSSSAGQSVTGVEMTVKSLRDAANSVRDFLENPTFSATSMIAIAFVIFTVGALFYGVRKKNI